MERIFEEKQKFTQWWLWVILLFFPIFSVTPFADYGDNGINLYFVLLGISIPLIFYLFELRTFVTSEGLNYQFFPFHLKTHIIKIDEIEKIEALQYKPLGDYGGWGIRYGFKGKAYNVSGNKGVKIYLPNERNILFGSQKNIELANALKKVYKDKQQRN
jgi:hypothetical protein